MSDYISKSAFSEALNKSEKQPTGNSEDYIEGYCEGWNDVIDIRESVPTLSETEVIRKAFERVVAQLNGLMPIRFNSFGKTLITVEDVIKILKEECGISE